MSASYARHAALDSMPISQARQIVEQVRAPWAAGGPRMHETTEQMLSYPNGGIRLRIHDPSPQRPKPALVYLHGGGWTFFSLDTHDRLMREYAAAADVVVVGVDYALSPEVKYPYALDQVVHVMRWLAQHGSQWNIDPSRLALGGDSAGGNLALAACLRLRDGGDATLVRAMLLNYAALDWHCSDESHRRYGGAGYMLGSEEMVVFWRNYVGEAATLDDPLVCPARAEVAGLPPAFFTIGECDILAQQNVDLARKLRAAGVAAREVVYAGASHSFLEAMSISDVSRRAIDEAAAWLRTTMGNAKPAR